MPLYTYRCPGCDTVFETLVRGDDQPACPRCGATALERQMSAATLHGKTKAAIGTVRSQAAREGHFSNYGKAELRGKI